MRATNHAYLLGLVLAFAGCGDNARIGFVVETAVTKQTITAGEPIGARCAVLDTLGDPALDDRGEPLDTSAAFVITYAHEDSFTTGEEGEMIAKRSGHATVRCAAPDLGLIDEEPEEIEIVAGPPIRVVTQLASGGAIAGEPVGVGCLAFDRFNNAVTGFKRALALSPFGAGAQTTAEAVTVTIAGEYTVSCVVDGAAEVDEDFLVVAPARPSSLVVAVEPERSVYAIDDQVTLIPEAHDRFGNRVDDIAVSYASAPGVPSPSEARFRFTQDGAYALSATVTSPTDGDMALSGAQTVFVSSTGPAIQCRRLDAPAQAAEAYMLQTGPSTVILPVRIGTAFQVDSVTIGDLPATFNPATGNYQAPVPLVFGMNFIDVIARDQFGKENSTTCFVLAAESYGGENTHLPGALGMRLGPSAIGDSIAGGLNSINDILSVVLSSSRLVGIVDTGLFNANPISDGRCGYIGLPPPCTPRIRYNAGSIRWNPPSSTLSLVPDGLEAQITLPGVRLTVNACGTACCIGGSTIDVRVTQIVATIRFSLQLQGGVLRAALQGSPNIAVGTVSLNGSGFCGLILELLEGFFAGKARTALRDGIANFINSDVAPLLDQLVSSLDINTLGAAFSVPRLDGSGAIALQFGLELSSFNITTSRALLGIGTRFTPAAIAHNRASLGVPRRTQGALLDPPGTDASRPVGLALYEGVLNEVLHGLWRGGLFQANLQLGFGSATIDARLPPVAAITGNQAQLMLGGIQATIRIPGIIDRDLQILFGGRASASVSLDGNALRFGNLTLTQLFVSFQASLTQNQRLAMADLLTQVLQSTLAAAINNGLPAFPIPTFALPPSVAEFGLPAGAELGILGPQLSTSSTHFNLTGSFGVRN